jgi:hypothetical protein
MKRDLELFSSLLLFLPLVQKYGSVGSCHDNYVLLPLSISMPVFGAEVGGRGGRGSEEGQQKIKFLIWL